MATRDTILDLKARMSQSIIGQEHIIERILIGLLANGNLLVEGLPGLAKTRAIKSLSQNLDAGLSRIQFTPDLLPSDIVGTEASLRVDGETEIETDDGDDEDVSVVVFVVDAVEVVGVLLAAVPAPAPVVRGGRCHRRER